MRKIILLGLSSKMIFVDNLKMLVIVAVVAIFSVKLGMDCAKYDKRHPEKQIAGKVN